MSLRINLAKWYIDAGADEKTTFKDIADADIHEHKVVTVTHANGHIDTFVVDGNNNIVEHINAEPSNTPPPAPQRSYKGKSPEEQLREFEEEFK